MEDVVIVSGVRTPIGSFGRAFRDFPAADLAAVVVREAVRQAGIEPGDVDEVVLGCVGQVGENAYLARVAALRAGLPERVPAHTVNRLCGSGLQALVTAAQLIRSGDAEVVVAGGAESMSTLPFYVRDARWGRRMGHGRLEDGLITLLSDPFRGVHMGTTAERVARRWGISRAEQDAFALESHRRAVAAIDAGRFRDQIVPVTVREGGRERVVDADEHPRRDTSAEALAALPPVFEEGGTVTAGNSAGINDGAAALVVMSARRAQALGLVPRLVFLGATAVGVDPDVMGIGPVPAVRALLRRLDLDLAAFDVVELNEAFAAQALAVIRELGLDPARTNPNGGAIALGHPVGATGAVLAVKLLYELERTGARRGLVTLCIGGGQGIAAAFARP